jgi:sulfate transport system permease protein
MSTLNRRLLPGFRLSLSYSLTYLTILVLIPIAACFAKASTLPWETFWATIWTERARAASLLTFGSSFAAAVVNIALGLLIAWVLVRYEFPLKQLFDSIIDLPLALPTAVAGLVYSGLYVQKGWFGQFLVPMGIEGAYSRLAIVLVLAAFDDETEEAALCLGASRLKTFLYVILPTLYPAIVTGFALAFARALGEYGSVVFVSGNMPYRTEIAPVLIVARVEEFTYGEATAVAVVLLVISFSMLIIINLLERWSNRYGS